MCFVSIYENKRMKPIEIVVSVGKGEKQENNGGDKSN
jgi:hypothetical protein